MAGGARWRYAWQVALCLVWLAVGKEPGTPSEVVLLEEAPRRLLLPIGSKSKQEYNVLGAALGSTESNSSNASWVPPDDCAVTSWQPFSACTVSCGGGIQHRTRNISTAPGDGGMPCPKLKQQRECSTQGCAEDAPPAPPSPAVLLGTSVLLRSTAPAWHKLLTASAEEIRRASTTTAQSPRPMINWVSGDSPTDDSTWTLVSVNQKSGPLLYGNKIFFIQRATGLSLWVFDSDAVKLVPSATCGSQCEFSLWKPGIGHSEEWRGVPVSEGRVVISKGDGSGYLRGAQGGRLLVVTTPTAKWELIQADGAGDQVTRLPRAVASVAQQKFTGNVHDWIDLNRPMTRVTEATSFSLCAMVQATNPSTGAKQPLIDSYEWGTYVAEQGSITFYVHAASQWMLLNWPVALIANQSTHFCAIYNADLSRMSLSVNGESPVTLDNCGGPTDTGEHNVKLGKSGHEQGLYFKGLMASVGVYEAALSTKQIAQVYTESMPIGCKVTVWTAFGRCSQACNSGSQVRTRSISRQARRGGASCPVVTEFQKCNTFECAQDCIVNSWGLWSDCNLKCGSGAQTRTRAVTVVPENGGASCPDVSEQRACNTHGCGCKMACSEPRAGVCAVQAPTGHYKLSWAQAVTTCHDFGAVLADTEQFTAAYEAGLDICHWGWLEDQSVRASAVTTLVAACGGFNPGLRGDTTPYTSTGATFDAFCYKAVPEECHRKPNSVVAPNLVDPFLAISGPLEIVSPYWLLSEKNVGPKKRLSVTPKESQLRLHVEAVDQPPARGAALYYTLKDGSVQLGKRYRLSMSVTLLHVLPVSAQPLLVLKLARATSLDAEYSPRLMMTVAAQTARYEVEFGAGAFTDHKEDPRGLAVVVELGGLLSETTMADVLLSTPELIELELTPLEKSNLVSGGSFDISPIKLQYDWRIRAARPAQATVEFNSGQATIFVTARGGAVALRHSLAPNVLENGKDYTVKLSVRAVPHSVTLMIDARGTDMAPYSYALTESSKNFTASGEWSVVELTFNARCADPTSCPDSRRIPSLAVLQIGVADASSGPLPSIFIKDVSLVPASATGAVLEQNLLVYLPLDEAWNSTFGREVGVASTPGTLAAVLHGFPKAKNRTASPWQAGLLGEAIQWPVDPVRPAPARVKGATISNSSKRTSWRPPLQWLALEGRIWKTESEAAADEAQELAEEALIAVLSEDNELSTLLGEGDDKYVQGSHNARLQMEKPIIGKFGCDSLTPTLSVQWQGKEYYSQYKFHAVVTLRCFKFDGSCPGNIRVHMNASEVCANGVSCYSTFEVSLGTRYEFWNIQGGHPGEVRFRGKPANTYDLKCSMMAERSYPRLSVAAWIWQNNGSIHDQVIVSRGPQNWEMVLSPNEVTSHLIHSILILTAIQELVVKLPGKNISTPAGAVRMDRQWHHLGVVFQPREEPCPKCPRGWITVKDALCVPPKKERKCPQTDFAHIDRDTRNTWASAVCPSARWAKCLPNQVSIYVDGMLAANEFTKLSIEDPQGEGLYFGGTNDTTLRMEASKLDEIRIYNKALSAETMMTLFQYRGLYAPYVGSWKVTLADEQRTPLLYTIDLSGWTTVTPLQAPSKMLHQGQLSVRGPNGQFALQTPNFFASSWQDISFISTEAVSVQQFIRNKLLLQHSGVGMRYEQCVTPPQSLPSCTWPLANASEFSPPAVTMQACVQCYVHKQCDLGFVGTKHQCQKCEKDWCLTSPNKTLCGDTTQFTHDAHAYGRCKGNMTVGNNNGTASINFTLSTDEWTASALDALAYKLTPGSCVMLWNNNNSMTQLPAMKLQKQTEAYNASAPQLSLVLTKETSNLTNATWQWAMTKCPSGGSSSWCGVTPNGYQWDTLAETPVGECLPCYELNSAKQCVHIEGLPKGCPQARQMPPVAETQSPAHLKLWAAKGFYAGCAAPHIPVACRLTPWREFGMCSRRCGVGHRQRFRSVVQQSMHNGALCGSLIETSRCNTHRCPQSCTVSPWQQFGQCSLPCGGGLQERHRAVLLVRADGGRACPKLFQVRSCNSRPCGRKLWYEVRSTAAWPNPAADLATAADGLLKNSTSVSAAGNTQMPVTVAFELGGSQKSLSGARLYKRYNNSVPTYEVVDKSPLCANSTGSLAAWTKVTGNTQQAALECNTFNGCVAYQQIGQDEFALLCTVVSSHCNNTAEPYESKYLAATTACFLKQFPECGKSDVDVMYSTDGHLPLTQRAYEPVPGLQLGWDSKHLLRVDAVTGNTLQGEAHDSTASGWGYITFDTILATALSFRVAGPSWCLNEVQLMGLAPGCSRTGGFTAARYGPGNAAGFGAPQLHATIDLHDWNPSDPSGAMSTAASWKCISLSQAAAECLTAAACVAFVYSDQGVKFKTTSVTRSSMSPSLPLTTYIKLASTANQPHALMDPADVVPALQYSYKPEQSVRYDYKAPKVLSDPFGATVAECMARCDAQAACAAFVRETSTLSCQLVLTDRNVKLSATPGHNVWLKPRQWCTETGMPCQADWSSTMHTCQVSPWTKWECNGDNEWRKRRLMNAPCELQSLPPMLQRRPCEQSQDCLTSEWTVWGACSVLCGSGQSVRTRKVLRAAQGGGMLCPQNRESKVCGSTPCIQDCEMGRWGEWGPCSAECDGGTSLRSRAIKKSRTNGGVACPETLDQRGCNAEDCGSCEDCTPALAGGSWRLVRRAAPGELWHKATDKLRGTDRYGTPRMNPTSAGGWSIPWAESDASEFLFATGDLSRWVVTTPGEILKQGDEILAAVQQSNAQTTPYLARWSNEEDQPQDPTIRVTSALQAAAVNTSSLDDYLSGSIDDAIVYREGAANGKLDRAGANVWIRAGDYRR